MLADSFALKLMEFVPLFVVVGGPHIETGQQTYEHFLSPFIILILFDSYNDFSDLLFPLFFDIRRKEQINCKKEIKISSKV